MQSPRLLPLHFAPDELPELESITEESEQPDVLLGQQLGEYVVRRYVGSGGMGVVYEGEHVTIGCKVAIKVIRDALTRGPHARGLLSEARAASAIRHRGIIDIFGFGQQPGLGQYLVMEYLEGRSLDQVIKERGPLPFAEALPLLCEVLDALSAAHAAGVIHRDLKPSNIFVVRQTNGTEYVKVLDFGLAKRTDVPNGTTPQTHSHLIVGTPQYMAPEQVLGEEVGPRTDLYAVGAIAFELLTGQRPFPCRSYMEVMVHHLKSPPPVPSSLVALPPEVDDLILRLLAKAPRLRPASASEVAQELRALLQQSEGMSGWLTRTVPALSPPSRMADAEEPTATLLPPAAMPPASSDEVPGSPWARLALGKWITVVAGFLLFALGGGWATGHGCTDPIAMTPPPMPVETSQEPVQFALQPQARVPSAQTLVPLTLLSAPAAQPQESLTPAAVPVSAAVASKPERRPTKKTPATPQPGAASAVAIQTPAVAPEHTGTGILHLKVKGAWADVFVDGQKIGRVPPQNRYTLTVGEHELELRNPAFSPYLQKIVIRPNVALSHTAEFAYQTETPTIPHETQRDVPFNEPAARSFPGAGGFAGRPAL